jgi:hypothetical protein
MDLGYAARGYRLTRPIAGNRAARYEAGFSQRAMPDVARPAKTDESHKERKQVLNKKYAVFVCLCVALAMLSGCASSSTTTPPTPGAQALQFVAYADGAVAAGEIAVAAIPSLSAADKQLASTALSDLGTGITCVYTDATATGTTTAVKVQQITACLQSLTIPPQASATVQNLLKTAFASVQAFLTA